MNDLLTRHYPEWALVTVIILLAVTFVALTMPLGGMPRKIVDSNDGHQLFRMTAFGQFAVWDSDHKQWKIFNPTFCQDDNRHDERCVP